MFLVQRQCHALLPGLHPGVSVVCSLCVLLKHSFYPGSEAQHRVSIGETRTVNHAGLSSSKEGSEWCLVTWKAGIELSNNLVI